MVSLCQHLGVRPFVLEIRSWSDNPVPVNLHQTNFILCSDKKEQDLRHNIQPPRSRTGWAFSRRLPQGPGPRPYPAASPRTPGARDPKVSWVRSSGPRGQPHGAAGLTDCVPGRQSAPSSLRGRGRGEAHCHLRALAWSVGSLGQGSGALQDADPARPRAPHPSPALLLVLGQRAPGRRPGSASYLALPGDHRPAGCRPSVPTKRCPVTAVTWGRGLPWPQPMAEQDRQRPLIDSCVLVGRGPLWCDVSGLLVTVAW